MATQLTLENFTKETGLRFRVSMAQQLAIKSGTLTREQAFNDFLANGGLEKLKNKSRPEVPDEVYHMDGLTLENFGEFVEKKIGVSRRFRVSREQAKRIEEGTLTREQALQETIAAKRQEMANKV